MKFKSAYTAGLNAGKVKPNTSNCHFCWFATQESMQEWERGNRDGKVYRAKKAAEWAKRILDDLNRESAAECAAKIRAALATAPAAGTEGE